MQKFTRDLLIAFILGLSVIIIPNIVFADEHGVEWRTKPVQCGPDSTFFEVLESHGEKALLGGITKLEGPGEPTTHWPVYVFVNTNTGTFTIAEFHLASDEVCVIGYGNGIDFDVQKYFEKYKNNKGT